MTATVMVKTFSNKKQKRSIICMVKNLEKKILPMDCGEANTCFQVLLRCSMLMRSAETKMVYIGKRKMQVSCHPIPENSVHGSLVRALSAESSPEEIPMASMSGMKKAPRMVNQKVRVRLVLSSSDCVDM